MDGESQAQAEARVNDLAHYLSMLERGSFEFTRRQVFDTTGMLGPSVAIQTHGVAHIFNTESGELVAITEATGDSPIAVSAVCSGRLVTERPAGFVVGESSAEPPFFDYGGPPPGKPGGWKCGP